MADIKTLPTLPRNSRLVRVCILSIEMSIEEGQFDAIAEVAEPTNDSLYEALYNEPLVLRNRRGRKGIVRLSMDAVNELSQDTNYMRYYLIEESHIEWET